MLNRGDWWLFTCKEIPKIETFIWKDQQELWPISNIARLLIVHCTLNHHWKILKDKYQRCNKIQDLWSNNVEPKKATLAWFVAYRAIWTNKKALRINKGNGLCQRCNHEEDNIHIFYKCVNFTSVIKRLQQLIKSKGCTKMTYKIPSIL